ncbi:sarcosine oxidase subunit delta [Falsiroseomonas oryziterrae]|uniref:sarcosine oxidase subunit delta n=1 Tax=Falsiroseomonas oryziterrae TaxID=2911368 RepID=UPI001F2E87E9|nr:sarcosine oxidase subunit delta [Roseomonas sp. NPKOSM-4]
MRIPCPFCGDRGNEEFTVLGAAGLARPAPEADDAAWHDYVHLRDNPAGAHRELWHHVFGCRAWLVVERDTRTHAVLSVTPAKERAA